MDVPSGEEGFLEVTRQPVDLVVSEVHLPGISGIELVHKLRLRQPGLKAIILSSVDDPKIKRAAEEAKADAYLTKPFPLAEFQEAIKRCLELTDLDEELVEAVEDQRPGRLSERLSILHKDVDAEAVVLLDDRGQITTQTGKLPENGLTSPLISALMAASSAEVKISRYLRSEQPLALFFFNGADYNLALTPFGQTFALLVATKHSLEENKLNQVIYHTLQELVPILTDMGTYLVEPILPEEKVELEPELLVSIEAPDHALEEIFSKVDKVQLSSEEVNAFWNTLAEAK